MILFLEPYFEQKPWAGNKLNKVYDCPDGTGEAWIASGYNKKSSKIISGKYKGETLRHLWTKHPELFGNFKEKEFPLLVKIIDAKEDLSVQVHPNDLYALEQHNQLGKFECWYFLNQNEAKTCIAGIDANKQVDVKSSIDLGIIQEKLIKRDINNGDLVIIEPGTVHAIQAGSYVLEVQESSDLTYRLFDYNRGRELHIEDALNVIKYNDKKNPVVPFQTAESYDAKFFNLEKVFVNIYKEMDNSSFSIVYVIDGRLNVNGTTVNKGDTFIICSDEKKIVFKGIGRCLMITPKMKGATRAKMRKVALITGIVTQDGSYLAEFLLNKGYEVHGLITSQSQLRNEKISNLVSDKQVMNNRLFFHVGDLTDTSSLNRILEMVKPDEIYHLASQSHVDISYDMPEYTAQVNALGTLRLLDAIKQSELRTRLFNESTCQIFDNSVIGKAQDENSQIAPKNPYATSKAYAHFIVKNYRNAYGLYAVNGILFNRTSIRDDEDFVFKKVVKSVVDIAEGKLDDLLVGNIDSERDWGYAPEYVECFWLALQQEKPDDYVISTGESHSVKELITLAFKYVNIDIDWVGVGIEAKGYLKGTDRVLVEVDPLLYRYSDNKYLCGDSTKAKTKLNWNPEMKFDEIINEMIKYERENRR